MKSNSWRVLAVLTAMVSVSAALVFAAPNPNPPALPGTTTASAAQGDKSIEVEFIKKGEFKYGDGQTTGLGGQVGADFAYFGVDIRIKANTNIKNAKLTQQVWALRYITHNDGTDRATLRDKAHPKAPTFTGNADDEVFKKAKKAFDEDTLGLGGLCDDGTENQNKVLQGTMPAKYAVLGAKEFRYLDAPGNGAFYKLFPERPNQTPFKAQNFKDVSQRVLLRVTAETDGVKDEKMFGLYMRALSDGTTWTLFPGTPILYKYDGKTGKYLGRE